MSKGKEDEKEKEKTMETSTIPSSEVFTFVKEQLKAIGFKLSFEKYDKVYSVTTDDRLFDIQSNTPKLIKVLKSPYANFVTKLDFASCNIKSNIKNFVEQLKDTSITTLDLTNNVMGDAGATALADAIKQGGSKITALYLNNNNIGDKGTKALADAIKQGGSKITALCLNNNNIGDKGTKALDGLKDIIAEVIYDSQHPSTTITSSTTSTTTTSLSTTSSLEKCFTSASFSSTSEPKTTPAVTTTALPLGGDPIDGESMSPTVTTLRTVTTSATYHSSTILFSPLDPATADPSPELTGQNPTSDTE